MTAGNRRLAKVSAVRLRGHDGPAALALELDFGGARQMFGIVPIERSLKRASFKNHGEKLVLIMGEPVTRSIVERIDSYIDRHDGRGDEPTGTRRTGSAEGADFIVRMLELFGVAQLDQIEGRYVYAIYEGDAWSALIGLELPEPDGGRTFMLPIWRKEAAWKEGAVDKEVWADWLIEQGLHAAILECAHEEAAFAQKECLPPPWQTIGDVEAFASRLTRAITAATAAQARAKAGG